MQIFGMTTDQFNSLSSFEKAKIRHNRPPLFGILDDKHNIELTNDQFVKNNQEILLCKIKNSYNMYENAISVLNMNHIEQESNGTLDPDDCAEYEPIITFIGNMTIDTKSLEHRLIKLQSQKKQLLSMISDLKKLQAKYKEEPWQLSDFEYCFDINTGELIAYKNQLEDLENKLALVEDEIAVISKELPLIDQLQITEDTIQEVEPSTFTYLLKETTTQNTYYRTIQTH